MEKNQERKFKLQKKTKTILFITIIITILVLGSLFANTLISKKTILSGSIFNLKAQTNLSDRKLEMKDIQNIVLYNQKGEELSSVSITDLANLDNYIVKVEMKDLPDFYSKIKSYNAEETLTFVLDYNNVVQYNEKGEKQDYLEVEYGAIKDGIAKRSNLSEFIKEISENPAATYTLTSDLDASNIASGEAIIPVCFTGTLNGNGHKIKNLSRPLFTSVKGGTIENLVIEKANIGNNGMIGLTSTDNSTLKNVHITKSNLSASNDSGSGAFFGNSEKTLFENCSATDVNVSGRKRSGIMIGKANACTIKNCYIVGSISSGSDAAGGMIGETVTSMSTIENCYVNIKTNFSWESGSIGGMIGNPGTVKMVNSLSLSTTTKTDGKAHGMRIYGSYAGSKINNSSSNNFELETSNMGSNSSHVAVSTVNEETLAKSEFYTDTLGWSSDIWDFSEVGEGKKPTLKNADPTYKENIEIQPSNNQLYIPNYARLKKLPNFDSNKEIAYHNLYKLMPFYDSNCLLEDGAKIGKNDILNTKIINQVLPYDENGKLIMALSKENKQSIKTIKILFKDDSTKNYEITYKESSDAIAHYMINDLNIGYSYNKYLIDTTSKSYNLIVSKIKEYDYTNDIASLTEETEVRNYVNNYPNVQAEAEEFAIKFLANNGDYIISNATNSMLDDKICKDLEANDTLKKVIYTYNYFDRFYDIEIGGINIRDIVFFDASIFSKDLNSMKMTGTMFATTVNYRKTSEIHNFYNAYIKGYTGKSLGAFFEYFMQNLTEEKYKQDPASWIIDNFKGTIYEQGVEGRGSAVRYRVWEHMKARELIILPILSYKGEDMYVLGIPSGIFVGDMREYFPTTIDKINYEDATKEIKLKKLKDFANNACNLYSSIFNIVDDDTINRTSAKSHINYDRANQKTNGDNPVKIGFHEVLGKWATVVSSAYANGTDVFWQYNALNFYTIWTHETVHNQDGYLFLEGKGRRPGAGGEMFTDGFLTQGIGEYGVVPNYTYNKNITDNVSTNLTLERINSREKMNDYYKKMFEVHELLEYLEGKAFLQLTPAEQSQIGTQAVDSGVSTSFLRLRYDKLSEEKFAEMNLTTLEDLWDNNIVAIRNSTDYIGSSNWYIGNSETVLTETVFKTLAYKILGDFGYDGYVAYAGGKYKSDLDIIRALTGDSNMTWKQYQMNKYANIESKLSTVKYFDTDEIVKEMVEAMKKDVANGTPLSNTCSEVILRKVLYGYIKRATNDFRSSVYEELPNVIHVSSEKQLLEVLSNNINANIILDKDLDFANIEYTTIDKTVTLTIDGNGHTIKGLKQPLINTMTYSKVKDLKVVDTLDIGTEIAKKMQLTRVEKVTLESGIATNVGGLSQTTSQVSIKDVETVEKEIEINTLEDFLKIGNTSEYPEYRLDKIYRIKNDIDFSGCTTAQIKTAKVDGNNNGKCIIAGDFTGKIYGDQHTLSNLEGATLFNIFKGSVNELNIDNFENISTESFVSAFARVTYGATLKDMNFTNITLKGNNNVSVITGMDGRNGANSIFERINVENADVTGTGVYVSTFIGRKYGGKIKDCYVQGNLEMYTTECGGVVGATHQAPIIENVVAKVNINKPKSTNATNYNGGLIGNVYNTPTIRNCISVGNMTGFMNGQTEVNSYKFIGCTEANITNYVRNCYEVSERTGISSVTENTKTEALKTISENGLTNEFYKNTLPFNEFVWNFDTIETLGHPILNKNYTVQPTAEIEYSKKDLTNQDVTVTLKPNKKVTVTNNDGKDTYTFTENGEFTFEFEDNLGNKGSSTAKVTWIDKEIPTATVDYNTKEPTNKDVTATITFSEEVTILNKDIEISKQEDGSYKYTFTENAEFELEYKDAAGNTGKQKIQVDWIDKVEPVATVKYDCTSPTAENVTATLECNEEIIITNNDGKNTYVFTENGNFTFNYKDKAGNEGSTNAEVTWINKDAPKGTISYDITESTNNDVTATLEVGENITITNNNGSNKYVFTDNGEFVFTFENEAGVTGSEVAKVNWIDKKAPTAEIEYSTEETTSDPVTVKIIPSEKVTITNNEGSDIYTFTENGEFTFEFVDEVGNKGSKKVSVSWIVPKQQEPENPDNPDDPNKPTDPEEPDNPDDPNKPTEPENPNKPGEVEYYLTSKIYNVDKENYNILKIMPNTTVKEFKQNIETNYNIQIVNKDGKVLSDEDIISTSDDLQLIGTDTIYKLIVMGDVDKDGIVTINDLALLKLHYIETELLEEKCLKAGDIDADGEITVNDIAVLKLILIDLWEWK